MTPKQEAALKLALSVLDEVRSETFRLLRNGQKLYAEQKVWNAIFVIKQALADSALDRMAENARELGLDYEPAQQEPVAVVSGYYGGQCVVVPTNPARIFNSGTAFYTSQPPSKPWVGLTEEEVDECYYWKGRQWTTDELVRHVEAKLREKNNG